MQIGDKLNGQDVAYSKKARADAQGAARSAAPRSGSVRVSGIYAINAAGDVLDPGIFMEQKERKDGTRPLGDKVTLRPLPPRVKADRVDNTVCIPTAHGVATAESHLLMFEEMFCKPAKQVAAPDLPVVVLIDCASMHGVDLTPDMEDVSEGMARLIDRYNLILVPLRHNTSTGKYQTREPANKHVSLPTKSRLGCVCRTLIPLLPPKSCPHSTASFTER